MFGYCQELYSKTTGEFKLNWFYIFVFVSICFILWLIYAYRRSVDNYYGNAPKAPHPNESFDDCRRECNTFYMLNYDEDHCKTCKTQTRGIYVFLGIFLLGITLIYYNLYCLAFGISNWITNNPILDLIAVLSGAAFVMFLPYLLKVLFETGQGYIT